jgi:tripartite-type tricarboxylate transporter receptor subunit TctC
MSRPYFAPDGVPADRVQALRRGFDATMKDAQFLADAQKSQIDIEPVTGEDVQSLVERLYKTPAPLAARARELLKPQQ